MSEKVYIGVDVSKVTLDVRVEGGRAFVQEKVVVCGHLKQTAEKGMCKRLACEVVRLDREIASLQAEMVEVVGSDARAILASSRTPGISAGGARICGGTSTCPRCAPSATTRSFGASTRR